MIDDNGQCKSCGRDFDGEQLNGQPCPAVDDCPSHFEEIGNPCPNHPDYKMNSQFPAKETGDMSISKADFITEISVMDPDSKEQVELSVYKERQSGGLFAIDNSYIVTLSEDDPVSNPFNVEKKGINMGKQLIKESWITGRRTENEDFNIVEKTANKTFVFSLPWYGSTINDDNDVFFPLHGLLGEHWHDGYSDIRECMRQSTMLEM